MLYDQPHLACRECDALLTKVNALPGQKLTCPRCNCVLRKPSNDTINRAMALCLTSLLMMVPAYFLPIMTFNLLGLDTVDTMVKGVIHLFDAGFWWMGVLVLFCSILAPMLESFLVLFICLLVKANLYGGVLIALLKIQSRIKRWVMLEVYMLGILVAYIKMIDSGQIYMGVGMICFSAMLLSATLNAVLFDTHIIWEKVGQHRRPHENR
jgi:paraquat-inducible protein A